jgi:hypothetical protein
VPQRLTPVGDYSIKHRSRNHPSMSQMGQKAKYSL